MSSSQTATKKVHHHVCFSDTAPVIHKAPKRHRNVDPEELFYSEQELAEMKKLTQVSVYFSKKELKQMSVERRGLEPASVAHSDDQKAEFVIDFLRLQRKLRHGDFFERQESLKSFVRIRSKNCEKEAVKMAKKDEVEAKRIYKADNITWTSADSDSSRTTPGRTASKTKSFLGSLVNGFRPSRESLVMGRAA